MAEQQLRQLLRDWDAARGAAAAAAEQKRALEARIQKLARETGRDELQTPEGARYRFREVTENGGITQELLRKVLTASVSDASKAERLLQRILQARPKRTHFAVMSAFSVVKKKAEKR